MKEAARALAESRAHAQQLTIDRAAKMRKRARQHEDKEAILAKRAREAAKIEAARQAAAEKAAALAAEVVVSESSDDEKDNQEEAEAELSGEGSEEEASGTEDLLSG